MCVRMREDIWRVRSYLYRRRGCAGAGSLVKIPLVKIPVSSVQVAIYSLSLLSPHLALLRARVARPFSVPILAGTSVSPRGVLPSSKLCSLLSAIKMSTERDAGSLIYWEREHTRALFHGRGEKWNCELDFYVCVFVRNQHQMCLSFCLPTPSPSLPKKGTCTLIQCVLKIVRNISKHKARATF